MMMPPRSAPRAYEPSRFNVAARAGDGALVAANSYSGAALVFETRETRRAQSLLSDGAATVPNDDVGKALIDLGFLVPAAASEPARLNELHDGLNDTSALHVIGVAGPAPSDAAGGFAVAEVVMSRPVRRAFKALLMRSVDRLRALRLSWMNVETPEALSVASDITAFAQDLAAGRDLGLRADAAVDLTGRGAIDLGGLARAGVRCFRLVIDVRAGEAQDDAEYVNALMRSAHSVDAGVAIEICVVTDGALPQALARLADGAPAGGVTVRAAARTRAEERAGCISTRAIAPGVAVCHAAKRNALVIGPTGTLHKCTFALDDPRNNVGRLTETGDLVFDADHFALWTGLDYRIDPVCGACFYAPACMGSACPLIRIRDGVRPCPEAKRDVTRSLEDIFARA